MQHHTNRPPTEHIMFAVPGFAPFAHQLTRDAAKQVARNWWVLLLSGVVLIAAGFLIFSIDWTIRELATFIGALFVFQGLAETLTTGIDSRVRKVNVITGLVSIAAGVLIIVWPEPGLLAVAVVLAAWLIVMGTLAITGAFAARKLLPNWWLLLIIGLLEIPLGVLALANPGATLAALVTVAGIWCVVIGVMRIVLAFEIKRLPDDVDQAFGPPVTNGHAQAPADAGRAAATT
jgi:uncharacterized membrane protein HdeD (DUF308 family)